MNDQENTKIAEQVYEAFNISDIEGFLNSFSEDISWEIPEIENVPVNGKFSGRENLAAFLAETDKYEEFLKLEPQEFIAQGDRIVVLGEGLMRSKTTDKQYATRIAHIYTIRDGKIVDFFEFFDNAGGGRAHAAAQTA